LPAVAGLAAGLVAAAAGAEADGRIKLGPGFAGGGFAGGEAGDGGLQILVGDQRLLHQLVQHGVVEQCPPFRIDQRLCVSRFTAFGSGFLVLLGQR
jgi:hypothetical protein